MNAVEEGGNDVRAQRELDMLELRNQMCSLADKHLESAWNAANSSPGRYSARDAIRSYAQAMSDELAPMLRQDF